LPDILINKPKQRCRKLYKRVGNKLDVMKKLVIFVLSLCFFKYGGYAQVAATAANTFSPGSELLIKAGVGFVKGGMPFSPIGFTVGAPAAPVNGTIAYPKNKMGLNLGLDYNYYWSSHFGASATLDFFSNKYKKIEASAPFVNLQAWVLLAEHT
jgi:hypothetical protein